MAYVLSSVSGNLISAASAGYAPTNSGDVSAIASAYQVVSSTATQFYAGTAYVTSVNEAPISASRAGQAANASMANSAYYDGTGRLISALPDEATVSAIASAYSESAASSKLDTTAQVVTATGSGTWDYDDCVSSVNGSPLYAKYAGLAYYDSALRNISQLPDTDAVSAIASSYAESAASSKQDTLTFGYNTADQISSIDGSALGGMDEAAVSAIASAYAESAASSKQDTLTFGYDADDKISSIDGSAIAGGEQVVTSLQYTTSQSGAIVGYTTGDRAENTEKVFSARYYPDQGWYNYQSATALASVGFTSLDSNITGEIEYPFEIFMIPYGTTNYGNIDYISSVDYYMSNYGQFNNTSDFRVATGMAMLSGNSAILDFSVTSLPFNTQYGPPMWGTAGGSVLGENEDSQPVFSVVYGSGSDREGRCARIVDGPKALGFGTITTISAVSGINELGIAGGGAAGVDSATCSAIASAYAAPKLDTSALERWQTGDEPLAAYSGIAGYPIHPTGADYAHEADYAESADSATYAESADYWTGASGKQDTLTFGYNAADQISSIDGSALGGMDEAAVSGIASAYAESAVSSVSGNYYTTANESGYALSSDVSATVDIVGTQSANWGGSALALSAGPGVKLEKVGNTLVAGLDETVLFSGSNGGMVTTNLTEPLSGFNSFKICFNPFGNGMSREWKEFSWAGSSDVYTIATFHKNGNDNLAWYAAFQPNTDGTTITPIANKLWILGSTTVQDRTQMTVYRVVGLNRTAEA